MAVVDDTPSLQDRPLNQSILTVYVAISLIRSVFQKRVHIEPRRNTEHYKGGVGWGINNVLYLFCHLKCSFLLSLRSSGYPVMRQILCAFKRQERNLGLTPSPPRLPLWHPCPPHLPLWHPCPPRLPLRYRARRR